MTGRGLWVAFGPCYVCRRVFGFNPVRVPSFDGQPICEECIVVINNERRKRGKQVWVVYPDSYSPAEDI